MSFSFSRSASGWSAGIARAGRASGGRREISPNVATNAGSSRTAWTRRGSVSTAWRNAASLAGSGMPHAAADEGLARLEVEVAAGSPSWCALARSRSTRKAADDVRLVGRLVLREADVAVDPERRPGRIGRQREARASNRSASATHSASSGCLRSRSYSALRGWNQARSLFSARSARNWMASGRKPAEGLGRGRSWRHLGSVGPILTTMRCDDGIDARRRPDATGDPASEWSRARLARVPSRA